MIGDSSYFFEFSNSSLYISAKYVPDFFSNDLGKVIIQQKDGEKLTIYDVKWVEWMALRIHSQDMEIDDLKKNHDFSCK